VRDNSFTARRMMLDVVLALVPVVACSVWVFGLSSLVQITVCVACCLFSESLFSAMRGRANPLGDLSGLVTGLILALSLPWSAPWYVGAVASLAAIGFGKAVFGGLGFNLFNPAMVGRAFVMLSFSQQMGTAAYVRVDAAIDALTTATPLALAKSSEVPLPSSMDLFLGTVNGSLGETSALACLLGGLYLCWRGTASWQIPMGVLLGAGLLAAMGKGLGLTTYPVLDQLMAGALFFGAFFIATDPVTSPLTRTGKFIFGFGVGVFALLIRLFSGYPEGVMFAVLLLNAVVPLINRWTVPRPFGGQGWRGV
jgi:electron transport complex protein RnfD